MSLEREKLSRTTEEIIQARRIKIISVNGEKIELATAVLPGLHAAVENPAAFIAEGKVTDWTNEDLLITWKAHRRIADKICTLTAGSVNLGFHLAISPFAPGGYYENLYETIAYDICFKSTNIPFPDTQEMIAAHEAAHCLLTVPVIPPGKFVGRAEIFEHDLSEHQYVTVPNISLFEGINNSTAAKEKAEELIIIKVAVELFPKLSSGISNLTVYFRYKDEYERKFPRLGPTLLTSRAFNLALRLIYDENSSPLSQKFSAEENELATITGYFLELYRQTGLKL